MFAEELYIFIPSVKGNLFNFKLSPRIMIWDRRFKPPWKETKEYDKK